VLIHCYNKPIIKSVHIGSRRPKWKPGFSGAAADSSPVAFKYKSGRAARSGRVEAHGKGEGRNFGTDLYIYGYIPIRPYKIEIQITTGDESGAAAHGCFAKFENFVLICITRGKMHHIWAESDGNSRAYTNLYKICNFVGLYFPHFKTFRNQTLQFY
jgi:hypothetical protein